MLRLRPEAWSAKLDELDDRDKFFGVAGITDIVGLSFFIILINIGLDVLYYYFYKYLYFIFYVKKFEII